MRRVRKYFDRKEMSIARPQYRGRKAFVQKRDWNIDPVSRYTLLCNVTHYIFNLPSRKIKNILSYFRADSSIMAQVGMGTASYRSAGAEWRRKCKHGLDWANLKV
jgi:hypothetical protein